MYSFNTYAQVRDWGDCVADNGVATLKCFEVVVGNIIFIFSTLIVVGLFIMFVMGSIRYILSGGNADKLKVAKATITYAFIGLALFIGAYIILNSIDVLFLGGGGKLLRFEIPEQ